ncbi:hypothetical protein SAMN04488093_10240 [Tropicibacter naphthalenivorans]|uniref:Sulfotransferase domain protein n=2 Tax=Tropicibacter naphthalenivorans TaxID=441103 RepID=A0A0N7LZG9_9RHOB|nr:hypothetical protein [Tropicibacter naphthalenivorans]CUH77633.1 hypothetical protein TRN7648_01577 [Tropicibacter naphthalenivorans]SMC54836.1 hypothetical protein SAMN04488093_10240 [Tropicibacter naphthalenivorans]
MIGQDFRETGWQIAPNGVIPTQFQVFGERSSGTNYVKRILGRNTVMQPIEDLGWKHGFPQMTAIPAHVAVVCVVRDARDWSLSMHAKPWHCPPQMQVLEFAEFIRAPWATIADRKRYFPQVQALGGLGLPLQLDRDPLTGVPFANLYALRRAKLAALLSFYNRGCTVVFCRMENVIAAPQRFVTEVQAELGLASPEQDFRPIHKRLGSRFLPSVTPRPATPKAMPDADLDFMTTQLDSAQEALLGYGYT